MLKNNLITYENEYKNVNKDRIKRIKSFISERNFTEKDLIKFEDELNRILNIEKETLKMIFFIIPETTPRPRINYQHGNFYVRNARTNNEFIKLLVEQEDCLKGYIKTPCKFTCKLYFPIPKTMNKTEMLLAEMGAIQPPIQKDWDNLGKTYSDMIQKWLLINDSLIVKGVSEKFWSFKPRVEIEIEYLRDFDCKYNKNLITKSKSYLDTL